MGEDIAGLFRSSALLVGLKSENPELYSYVFRACQEVLPVLRNIPDAFGEFTDHGFQHSRRVLELGQELLGQESLNPWEIAVFALACFYHDVGMSCPRDSWEELERTSAFRREAGLISEFALPAAQLISADPVTIRTQTITEYLRRHHGERGRRWILSNRPEDDAASFIDGVYLWSDVARVGVGHTLDVADLELESSYPRSRAIGPAKKIDVRFLTCLLRLADICHLSRDRALPYLARSLQFTSRRSEKIWQAHAGMAGVSCNSRRSVIVVSGEPHDFEAHRLIHESVLEIQRELANCHRLLAAEEPSLLWKFVDSSQVQPAADAQYDFVEQGRFRLEEDKIVSLLMGSRLYAEPLYAVRECVQNALDAISVVRLQQPTHEGVIVIYLHDSDGSLALDVFDNGTGMDRLMVVDHLLAAGAQSFVRSERRAREWGDLGEGDSFIACHGIGFLSCFMIADSVEVFSKYRNGDPVWIRIDSPTRNVAFLRGDMDSEFPAWPEGAPNLPTPWQLGHGTCVRLRLAEEFSIERLMEFIASDLPRVASRLFIVHAGDCIQLRANWRRETRWQAQEELSTLAALEQALFGPEPESSSFFEGPPKDAALKQRMVESEGIRGLVSLSEDADARYANKVTQNGILIREGAADIWRISDHGQGVPPPFDFNIDITGKLSLELDAERARVLDSPVNRIRCRRVADWLEKHALESLKVLESPLYFPCGGSYYHGGIDLLRGHSGPTFHFHRELRDWYTPDQYKRAVGKFGDEAFMSARLYAILGEGRSNSVSVQDLLEREDLVLAVGPDSHFEIEDVLSDELEDGNEGSKSARWKCLLRKLRSYAPLEELLWTPSAREFFAMPLLARYEIVSKAEVEMKALVIKLRRRSAPCLPDEDDLRVLSAGGGRMQV